MIDISSRNTHQRNRYAYMMKEGFLWQHGCGDWSMRVLQFRELSSLAVHSTVSIRWQWMDGFLWNSSNAC